MYLGIRIDQTSIKEVAVGAVAIHKGAKLDKAAADSIRVGDSADCFHVGW